MTCSGAYAQAADYEALLCAGLDLSDAGEVALVNSYLALAASDIHAAVGAVGACNCTLEPWAVELLKKLNVISAAIMQGCPCGNRLDDDRKRDLGEWLERQLELIREGKLPLCQGDTGSAYPAFGSVEHSWTVWGESDIAWNDARRRRR